MLLFVGGGDSFASGLIYGLMELYGFFGRSNIVEGKNARVVR